MPEEKKHKSTNLAWLGCLLVFPLVLASVFLGGFVLSRSGIGVIGNAKEATQSPVGLWNRPKGGVIEFRADGTGSSISGGSVSYFEWRLSGNDLSVYGFSNPNSAAARIFRLQRGLGLTGERGHDNYKLLDVTAEELTLAIDDEPRGPNWKRGDQIEFTAATEETAAKTTSVEFGE